MGYAENGDWFSSYSGANIDNLLGCGKINLIDNAYFGYDPFPINQQGATSYTKTNGDICIDRWKQYSGTVEVLDNALSIRSPAAGVVMSQKLSAGACAICRTYTACSLSVVGHADRPEKWWVRLSTDGTKLYFPELFPGYTAGCATTSVVSSSSTNNIVLEIGVDNPSGGDYLLLRAIKLEPITSILGASQTLYVIEDSGNGPVAIEKNVPNYDEELAKCQRYLQVFEGDAYAYLGTTYDVSSTSIEPILPLLVPMSKKTGSILASTTALLQTNGAWNQQVTIPAGSNNVRISSNTAAFTISLANGLLGTFPSMGAISSDGNTKIIISTE